jgi:uncharacterized protein YbjT (DUF2867 family)
MRPTEALPLNAATAGFPLPARRRKKPRTLAGLSEWPQQIEARAIVAALRWALDTARPTRVVCLSTIGARATQPNLLNQLGIVEQTLGELPMPVAFLRAAWFMENSAWDVGPARP